MENPISQRKSNEDFIQLLIEKANIIKNHVRNRQSPLVLCANIGPNIAIFKLFNRNEENSLKLRHYLKSE